MAMPLAFEHKSSCVARSDNRQNSRTRLAELGQTAGSLRQDRLRSQEVIGKEFPSRGQCAATGLTLDQNSPDLILKVSNVFGHSGLADPQLLCGPGKGAQAGKSRQGAQSCFQSHNLSLYQAGQLCIFVGASPQGKQGQKTLYGCPAWGPGSTSRSSDLAHL